MKIDRSIKIKPSAKIKELVALEGITIQDLATKTGVNISTLYSFTSNKEVSRVSATLRHLRKIAVYFGMHPEFLYNDKMVLAEEHKKQIVARRYKKGFVEIEDTPTMEDRIARLEEFIIASFPGYNIKKNIEKKPWWKFWGKK